MKKEYIKLDIPESTQILEVNIPRGRYPKYFESVGDKLYIYFAENKWKLENYFKAQKKPRPTKPQEKR